jgi:flagella basal body P-ring formation protein FlgA
MILAFLFSLLSLVVSPGGKLKEDITSALMRTYSGYKSIEIEFTKSPNEFESAILSSSKSISVNNNIALVPVLINKRGTITEKYISVRIKLFKDVYKCVREVDRNSQLKQSDCMIETVDIALFKKKPVEISAPISELMSRANLRPGEILFYEDLLKVPVVKNGDRITANYNLNGVTVSFEAVARQNGAEGDCIFIMVPDKKQFKAKVINNSTVEVME